MGFRDVFGRRDRQSALISSPSRGGDTRTFALVPALFWTFAALAPASLGFGAAGAAYFVFHDTGARAFVARAEEAQARRRTALPRSACGSTL